MKKFYLLQVALFFFALCSTTSMLKAQSCGVIYVTPTGTDQGDGSELSPMNLKTALTQACLNNRKTIRVIAGEYLLDHKVVLGCDSLIIDGDWEIISGVARKNSTLNTIFHIDAPLEQQPYDGASGTLVGTYIGVEAIGVRNVHMEDLNIYVKYTPESGVATGTTDNRGNSVYGMYFRNCLDYRLERCQIMVGAGSAGAPGTTGAAGSNGSAGGNGTGGACNDDCIVRRGGYGGAGAGAGGGAAVYTTQQTTSSPNSSNCYAAARAGVAGNASTNLRAGGSGGSGGNGGSEGRGGAAGARGGNGANGATVSPTTFGAGGSGNTTSGAGTCSAVNGKNGTNGTNGIAGTNGAVAAQSTIHAFFWLPTGQSDSGTDGYGGSGGSGGGGGGGQGCTFCTDGTGSAGGGGGGGGQGGVGGTGAWGNGGSFGLYSLNSTGTRGGGNFSAAASAPVSQGGAGGTGGTGGAGGIDLNQAGGFLGCSTCEVGTGGSGGRGGNGGNGGRGGDGAPGVSFNVYPNNAAVPSESSAAISAVITSSPLLGCTNSEITLTKPSTTTWTSPMVINDVNQGVSSYNTSSNTIIVSYPTIGWKDIVGSFGTYKKFIHIGTDRPLPTFMGSMQNTVCEGEPFNMGTSTTGTQYEWIVFKENENAQTPVAIFNTQVATWNTQTGSSAGSYRVRLRIKDNCCGWSTPVYFSFVVSAAGATPTTIGDTICQGGRGTITALTGGASIINFYGDALGQIVLQSGSDSTYTTAPLTQNTVFYVGTGSAACSRNLAAVQVTINPKPLAPSANDINICANQTATLNAVGQGGTINWYNDLTSTTPLATGNTYNAGTLAAGTHIYYAEQVMNGCPSDRIAVTVTVNPLPNSPLTTSAIICAGNSISLSAVGTNIRWYSDAALTNQIATGNTYLTPVLTTSASYYVVSTNADGCASTASMATVTVENNPTAPTISTANICQGNTATLTATGNGGTINWYADATATVHLSTGTSYTTPVLNTTTTYFVTETNANGCVSPIANASVVVSPRPDAAMASANVICEGEDLIITASAAGTGSFVFYDNNMTVLGNATLPNATYTISNLAAGNHLFYVGVDNGTCISNLTTVNAVINASPSAPTASNITICANTSTTLTATGIGVRWFTDAALSNQVYTGNTFVTPILSANTTYYITSTNTNNCSSSASSVIVSIEALPAMPTVANTTICAGNTATLTASNNGGTTTWYSDATATMAVFTGNSFTTPVLSTTTTYFVRESNANGCLSPIANATVTVNPLTAAPNATATTICEGEDLIINASAAGTGSFVFYDDNMTVLGNATLPNAAYTISGLAAGSHLFYVGIDNGICVSSLAAVNTVVNATPTTPTANNITICENASATLTATGNTIRWYADAALTNQVASGNTFFIPTLATTITYYFTSSNNNNCASAAGSVTVTVEALPIAPVVANTTICAGNTATLTASNNGGTTTWYSDATATMAVFTGTSFTTPVLSTTTTYFVRESNANGCLSAITPVTVSVTPLTTAPNASALAICEGEDLIINASAAGTGSFVFYDDNMTVLGNATLPNGTYTVSGLAAGSHLFYIGIDNGGCLSNLATVNALVNTNPIAPTAAAVTVCANTSATLTATGNNIRWYADAGLTNNIGSGNTFNTPVLVTNTTFYFTSANANGCTSAAADITVQVNPAIAAPTTANTTVCSNGNTTLTATAAGNGTLNWYSDANGINLVATGTSYAVNNVTYTQSYFVREVDANGCMSSFATATIVVNPTPSAPSTLGVEICEGSAAILSATGSGNGVIVFYNSANTEVGRGTMSTSNRTITVSIPSLTTGTHVFTAVEEGTCNSAPATIQVRVNNAPTNVVASNDGPACEGDDVVLQASVVAGANYTWTGPNGFVQIGQTIFLDEITSAQAGVYSVIANVGACASTAATTTVSVNARPSFTGNIMSNSPLCENDNLTLTAPSVAGVTYAWTGPYGFSATGNTVNIANVNEDMHQGAFTVYATDANGCQSLPISTYVNINVRPTNLMVLSNSPVCENGTLNLSIPSVFGATYAWSGPNGFTSTAHLPSIPNISTNGSGTYEVAINVGGCITTLNTEVAVNALGNISITPDSEVLQGSTLGLSASGGMVYQWTGETQYLSNTSAPNPIFTAENAGSFTYEVNIMTMGGCIAQRSVTINVKGNNIPEFVDLFTPNGDGINDTWEIGNLANVGNYTLKVYSRGGFEVFSTEAYANDWDGTNNGKALADGTYWYVLKIENGTEYRGAVTIKR